MKLEEKFIETVKRLQDNSDKTLVKHQINRGYDHPIVQIIENLKKDILCSIESKIENPKHHQYYIDYILAYLTKKPNAYVEDIEAAIDTAKFFRENKHLYEEDGSVKELNDLTPTQLGLIHDRLQAIMVDLKQKSKNEWIRLKSDGILPKGIHIDIAYQDKKYTVYKVPKLPNSNTVNEEDKEKQHLKYCVIGKGTKWCTANPVGTYYSHYLNDDIYAVWENGKPLYQFSIRNNSVGQFMDVNDHSVDTLKAELIDILESLFK